MIFPFIQSEDTVQVNDKFRIGAEKSFISKDEPAITKIEIRPEAGDDFIDVTGIQQADWYLDWEYATDGDKVVSVRVTTDGVPVILSKTIKCLSVSDDNLFSTDQQLKLHESDILKYVPRGRNTFKNKHREAQTLIMEYFYKIGLLSNLGNKLTKADVIDVTEVREWAKFFTLALIFWDQSTTPTDFFQLKGDKYKEKSEYYKHKAILKLDLNQDGTLDKAESIDITWRRIRKV